MPEKYPSAARGSSSIGMDLSTKTTSARLRLGAQTRKLTPASLPSSSAPMGRLLWRSSCSEDMRCSRDTGCPPVLKPLLHGRAARAAMNHTDPDGDVRSAVSCAVTVLKSASDL